MSNDKVAYVVEIFDACEGLIIFKCNAANEDEAYDEAAIYASERGCREVLDVGLYEDMYYVAKHVDPRQLDFFSVGGSV